jgi:hypothetical protein
MYNFDISFAVGHPNDTKADRVHVLKTDGYSVEFVKLLKRKLF